MTGNLLRNWFVPKDGISREVISADIQRFLGNDATVRPGKELINQKEVEGYWIRAYRNLTSEMINDLKVTTQKWDREQRSGTGRGRVTNYEDSHTFRSTNHGYGPMTTGSPSLDGSGPFQPPTSRSALPPQDMPAYQDPRAAYPIHSVPPGTSAYVEPPLYAPHRQASQSYAQQPDYYSTTQPYHEAPQHIRSSPQYSGPQYGNGHNGQYAQQPRDPRDDPRNDPRNDGRYQPDYQDPRYNNYPPATSGGPIANSSQPISYPSQPRYDQFGRPVPIPDPPYRPSAPPEPPYHPRERPSGQQGPDARRRRMN